MEQNRRPRPKKGDRCPAIDGISNPYQETVLAIKSVRAPYAGTWTKKGDRYPALDGIRARTTNLDTRSKVFERLTRGD